MRWRFAFLSPRVRRSRAMSDSIEQSFIRITPMLEVHSVWATVRPPKDATDLGQVTIGYYTLADELADGVLTMTDSTGAAVRERQFGEKYTHKLKPGEDART